MPNFEIYNANSAPEKTRGLVQQVEKNYGFLPNLFGVFAASEAAASGYAQISAAFGKADLTEAEQQVVVLTASRENDCRYCVAAHSTIAGGAGLSDEDLNAIRDGETLPDARLNALSEFTRDVVRERGWVREDTVQKFLDAGFTTSNVLDVITGVTMKTLSNYTSHIAGQPVDQVFSAKKWEPAAKAGV